MSVRSALVLLLAAAAVNPAHAERCGVLNSSRPCTDRTACCSVYGYCGKTARFCAVNRCASGPCEVANSPGNSSSSDLLFAKTLCGVLRGGKPCLDPKQCCSKKGFCGTNSTYCAYSKCASGPCRPAAGSTPKPPSPPPKLRSPPSPSPKLRSPPSPPPKLRSPPSPPPKLRSPPSPPPKLRSPPSPPPKLRSPPSPSPKLRSPPSPSPKLRSPPSPSPKLRSPPSPSPKLRSPPPRPRPRPSPPSPSPSPAPRLPSPAPPSPSYPVATSPPPPPPSPSPQNPQPFPPFPGELGDAVTQYSWLWGRQGELWTPTGRLIDWSYSGYMVNERAIPDYPIKFNVLNYGAKGDGVTDDSKAIIAAITAASAAAARLGAPSSGMQNEGKAGVAVLLPAGRYKITQFIELRQSNVAVRGEGVDRTVLYFPRALGHIYGNMMEWSYMGGFLTCRGRRYDSGATQFQLARITAGVRKGDRRLPVSTTQGITVGRWVRLYATKPLSTARRTLLEVQDPAEMEKQEKVKVQVEPWQEENWEEKEDWEEDGSETEAEQQPASRHMMAMGDESGSSDGSTSTTKKKRRMCGRKGDRHHCRRVTNAMRSWRREAEALGLDQPEQAGEGSDNAEGGNVSVDGSGDKAPATSAQGTLDAYIYMENAVDSGSAAFSGERIRFIAQVSAVGSGWIELSRPLPYDLRPEWQVAVYSFEFAVQHVGYEDFTVEFQWDIYPAHFQAKGYNAFWFQSCANAWIRNVRIIDADNGAEAINCDMVTMKNITLEFTRDRGNKNTQFANGHHGLWAASSSLVHFTEFNFKGKFIHDLTLDVWSQECAYSNGKGVDMSLDMHRGGVHNNLWTNIDVGLGSRPFQSSGNAVRGAHAASNNTWWGIYASGRPGTNLAIPPCDYGPQLNWVGGFGGPARGEAGIVGPSSPAGTPTRLFPAYCTKGVRWWVEQKRAGVALYPPDLFTAMLNTRLGAGITPAFRQPKN